MGSSVIWEGLGGLSHGSFFRTSGNDSSMNKPPGMSLPPHPPESLSLTIFNILTGKAFCYSPSLSWFLMAVGTWCIFPYDLQESNHASLLEPVKARLVINYALALAYIGFWHWALYFRGFCHRPFVPNRTYSFTKVSHNFFYTVLGILHWTFVEAAFLYLYTTKRLPYVAASTNLTTLLQTLILSFLLPAFRDVHFYFAHRLIHLRPLYKYVHSLHHRNTDTEPFSGLAMHPVEHMYYFTCYWPLLVLPLWLNVVVSPFLVYWMGVHLVISPTGAHSGYEDHFAAHLAHYLHHRYSECNYSAGINFDVIFGTHKSILAEIKSSGEQNSHGKNSPKLPPPPSDPKSSLGFPEHPQYEVGVFVLVLWTLGGQFKSESPWWVALLLSVGPAVWAVVLALWSAPKSISWRKACLSPFDRDSVASLGLHLGLGILLGVLPATHLLILVLRDND